jgi:hypothetical protein
VGDRKNYNQFYYTIAPREPAKNLNCPGLIEKFNRKMRELENRGKPPQLDNVDSIIGAAKMNGEVWLTD